MDKALTSIEMAAILPESLSRTFDGTRIILYISPSQNHPRINAYKYILFKFDLIQCQCLLPHCKNGFT